jgi:multidrug efflux pump subunit AcrA (membrane-fusion protein)
VPWSRGVKIGIAVAAVLIVVGSASGAWWLMRGFRAIRTDLLYHKLTHEKLQLTIVERGTLESADNRDVVCRVKASAKGGTISSTIKSVIDNGTYVEANQLLLELDDSGLQDQLQNEKINTEKAKAEWIKAVQDYLIQESQNESDIATAKVNLDLAILNLEQYKDGKYLVDLRDIEGRHLMARSDLEMWEERSGWSERMSRPGRRYVTAAQADSDRARMVSAGIALKRVEEEKRMLEEYTARITIKDLQSKIDEAKRALDRVQKQAVGKIAGLQADRSAKYSTYLQQQTKVRDLEDEIRKCTLRAPQEGLVVYYIPEQTRSGSGTQQAIVAQGEPVREGQKLMSIPNLSRMLVNTRVHEAMISKVRGDRMIRTGFSDAIDAATHLAADTPFALAFTELAYNAKRMDVSDAYREHNEVLADAGQPATIRIDSIPGRIFKGHVKTVATVASQQDWMSSDVKVYQTMVSIDEEIEGVRPGMSAEVTILTDAKAEDVLAIPVEAILGGSDMGRKRKCFVKTPVGPAEREIVIGMSNDTKAEILSGLEEGDEVVLNPLALLKPAERQTMETGANRKGPRVKDRRPSGEAGEGENGKSKGKGKNGWKKGAGNPGEAMKDK